MWFSTQLDNRDILQLTDAWTKKSTNHISCASLSAVLIHFGNICIITSNVAGKYVKYLMSSGTGNFVGLSYTKAKNIGRGKSL